MGGKFLPTTAWRTVKNIKNKNKTIANNSALKKFQNKKQN
jgi:hypothetical protein